MSRRIGRVLVGLFVWTSLAVAPSGQSGTNPAQVSGATIVGTVVDAALNPLGGVAISLERAGQVVAKTTTAASGAFRFAAVAPGDYTVRATHSGFPAFTRTLRVPNGARTLQLPIVLARASDTAPNARQELERSGLTPMPSPPPPPPSPPPPPPAGRGGAGGGRGGTMALDQLSSVSVRQEAWPGDWPPPSGESYAHIEPNRFQSTLDRPLSTFGADVDTASYANVRRMLSTGQLPPADAVRVEEFVNYFRFNYGQPRGTHPIALTTEIGDCPWAPAHKLVLIGARAGSTSNREVEGRNIVLLIDVSGSMSPAERLPLIKTALGLFVDTLRPDDRLAIVTYAGSSGVWLPSTPARRRDVIQQAIAGLGAGGSTNGASGLITAYRTARENFIPGGINRVILATDGDFNVGVVNQRDLLRLIEQEKESGVFLSVFGVGSGNLKDSTMEMLADKGNGHYAYLDSLQEARRVLVREADSTMETVAKDVKFQVEFNPAVVGAWKLIGYENRLMPAKDFNNDRKDGGEMGAGHTVTVLYEVVPAGATNPDDGRAEGRSDVDPLKYQAQPRVTARPVKADPSHTGEWLTVKVRYKAPEGEESELMTQAVRSGGRVQHLPLASAVAEFGLLLRSGTADRSRWDALVRRIATIDAPSALAADKDGFAELVALARGMARLR